MSIPGEAAGPSATVPLSSLSAPQQRLLAYASAIGREFDFPLLTAAMEADEEPLAEQLEELVHQGILRERSGGDRFAFVQDELRASVYQSMTGSRLRVIHRRVAEAMERLRPEPDGATVRELGRHYFLGKVPEKSVALNREAARVARGAGQLEAARHHLERVRLDLKSVGKTGDLDEVDVLEELANVSRDLGDLKAADGLYGETLELLGEKDSATRARLLVARGEVAHAAAQPDVARRHAREAHDLFSRAGDVGGSARVRRLMSQVAFQQGNYREALDLALEAFELAQEAGPKAPVSRILIEIGDCFERLGPEVLEEAVDWYRRAFERLEAAGDWGEAAWAHIRMGAVVGRRNPSDGLEHLERARMLGERGGRPDMVGWALLEGVELRLALGQSDDAERENLQATRLMERGDNPLGLVRSFINLGLIREKRGQWDEAKTAFEEGSRRGEGLNARAEVAEARFYLARLAHKTRDDATAFEYLRESENMGLSTLAPRLAPGLRDLKAAIHPT